MDSWSPNRRVLTWSSAAILLLAACTRQAPPSPRPSPAPVPEPAAKPSPVAFLQREPIYFLKYNATLSPKAYIKLKEWVRTWGGQGTWSLGYPSTNQASNQLTERRLNALRSELQRLGVTVLQTRSLSDTDPTPYDAIYVIKERP